MAGLWAGGKPEMQRVGQTLIGLNRGRGTRGKDGLEIWGTYPLSKLLAKKERKIRVPRESLQTVRPLSVSLGQKKKGNGGTGAWGLDKKKSGKKIEQAVYGTGINNKKDQSGYRAG